MTEPNRKIYWRNLWGPPPKRRDQLRDEDRRRQLENLGALFIVVGLLVAGFWLIDRLINYSHNMACLESKHSNCR